MSVDDYVVVGRNTRWRLPGASYSKHSAVRRSGRRSELRGSPRRMHLQRVVFACMLVRQLVFSSVRFTYQRMRSGAPSDLFGTAHLQILERPWVGGTTQDMLARMIQDADLHGNSYWTVIDGQLVRLRPDWVDVVARRRMHNGGQVGWEKLGYIYTEGGRRGCNRGAVQGVGRMSLCADPRSLIPVHRHVVADADPA